MLYNKLLLFLSTASFIVNAAISQSNQMAVEDVRNYTMILASRMPLGLLNRTGEVHVDAVNVGRCVYNEIGARVNFTYLERGLFVIVANSTVMYDMSEIKKIGRCVFILGCGLYNAVMFESDDELIGRDILVGGSIMHSRAVSFFEGKVRALDRNRRARDRITSNVQKLTNSAKVIETGKKEAEIYSLV